MTAEQVVARAARMKPFFDHSGGGITLTGGEVTAQSPFAAIVLRNCKRIGIHTAVETTGACGWPALERIVDHADLILYDLKLMDDARHRRFTGVTNAPILENLRALSAHGHHIVLRVPVIPGITDDAENLAALAAFAAGLPHLAGVDLLPYHPIGTDKYARLDRAYPLSDTAAPSAQRMAEIARLLTGHGLRVSAGHSR